MTSLSGLARTCTLYSALAWFFVSPVPAGQKAAGSSAAAPAIVVDSPAMSDFGELNQKVKALENPSCNGGYRYLDRPTVVADFVGGKVKTIRVVRLARQRSSAKPEEVRQAVKKVWQGSFQSGFCQIPWAEAAFWSIEAEIEFDDGKQGALVTDGVHVVLKDHEGKSWFFRLLPAAQ